MTNNLFLTPFMGLDNFVGNIHTLLGDFWFLILYNAFGLIAVALRVTEFQLKSRAKRYVVSIGSYIAWIFYFFLQNGYTTALVSFVCAVQCLIFLQREKHKWAKSIVWLILFLAIHLTISFMALDSWRAIFSISAGVFATIGYFVISEKYYRIIMICSLSSWVLSSAFNLYIVALCSDCTSTVSAIIGLIRYYHYRKDETQKSIK